MASGVGFFGGVSQCYDLWHSFAECHKSAARPAECKLHHADFQECLHKRKQKLRMAKAMMHITDEAARKDGSAAAHGGGHH